MSTGEAAMVDLTNSGLLILRLLLGLVVIGHGIQKVSFRLGGGGLEAEAAVLAKDGVRGGRLSAAVSGVSQIGAGLLISLGLLTFLGAAGTIGVMTVASATKLRHGFWVQNDGYEFPLFLCLTGVVLALSGPGAWSLDHVISLNRSWATSGGAIALGAASGCISAVLLRRPRKDLAAGKQRPATNQLTASNLRDDQ